jgi:hypothetical protein
MERKLTALDVRSAAVEVTLFVMEWYLWWGTVVAELYQPVNHFLAPLVPSSIVLIAKSFDSC